VEAAQCPTTFFYGHERVDLRRSISYFDRGNSGLDFYPGHTQTKPRTKKAPLLFLFFLGFFFVVVWCFFFFFTS